LIPQAITACDPEHSCPSRPATLGPSSTASGPITKCWSTCVGLCSSSPAPMSPWRLGLRRTPCCIRRPWRRLERDRVSANTEVRSVLHNILKNQPGTGRTEYLRITGHRRSGSHLARGHRINALVPRRNTCGRQLTGIKPASCLHHGRLANYPHGVRGNTQPTRRA
jgi:hypothetical protein